MQKTVKNVDEYLKKDLPKWPELRIAGESVTEEQAEAIIVQTNGRIDFSSNHHRTEFIYETIMMGKEDLIDRIHLLEDDLYFSSWFDLLDEQLEKKKELSSDDYQKYSSSKYRERSDIKVARSEELGILTDLYYLTNRQIMSSWIGGVHGWCQWDGTIGCQGFNIGKWPTGKDIYDEAVLLAETYPFLEMTIQIMAGESCEIDDDDVSDHPIFEFKLSEGKVYCMEPEAAIHPNTSFSGINLFMEKMRTGYSKEIGCSEEKLKHAVQSAIKLKNQKRLEQKV